MTDNEKERFQSALQSGADAIGISLTEIQVGQCLIYVERMLTVNEHTNLTRITEPEAVAVKHFVDSLTVLKALPASPHPQALAQGATVADIGTGVGFPGLALKIVRPDLHMTLMDSLGKRLTFLQEVISELELTNVTTVHARAEDAGRNADFRDHFDLVTARAVAALPTLLEWCTPLVRQGGRFVAMKSAGVDAEIAAANTAAGLLQVRLTADHNLTLPSVPGDDEPAARRLIVYAKLRPTPSRFPRRTAEIKQAPLQ